MKYYNCKILLKSNNFNSGNSDLFPFKKAQNKKCNYFKYFTHAQTGHS